MLEQIQTPHISIVVPVYGCKTCLVELYFRLVKTLETINSNFEIILVNDASPDGAWETIIEIASKENRVKGINLSRNFGQHYAITAGLDFCKGDWVVVMDCDLQDQPEEIVKLYNKALEGFDIVLGKRSKRKDSYFKVISSLYFYKLFSYLADTKFDPSIGTFRILAKKVVESYKMFNERLLYFGAMINWLGFKTVSIDIIHKDREHGRSTYNFRRKITLAINGILSFSNKPLKLTIKMGVFLSFLAIVFILIKVSQNLLYGTSIIGWSSLIAAIGFSTGVIVSVIGVVGLYVGSIFQEVKKRPNYICSEKINIE